MKTSGTSIKLKRTKNNYSNFLTGAPTNNTDVELPFGEPLFIDNESKNHMQTGSCEAYMVVGSGLAEDVNDPLKVSDGRVFKAFINKEKADSIAFINESEGSITDEDNNAMSVNRLTTTSIDAPSTADNKRYYILVQDLEDETKTVRTFKLDDSGIYITGNGVMHGAAWNDFAEYRQSDTDFTPGTIVCDDEGGFVTESKERLQRCSYVVSDTYGMVIGDRKGNVPVAVAGRVLANVDCDVEIGDCLCATEGGKATKMSRLEIANYPDRILGIVSEIPTYAEWNGVEVKERVWVKIK